MAHLTHTDWETLRSAWYEGNEDDLGSAFGEEGDTCRQAIEREGFEVFAVSDCGKLYLAHTKHKHYYVVLDDNGPWGVDVTQTAKGIFGTDVMSHA